MQKHSSLRVTDQLSDLLKNPEPVVALNLMGFWLQEFSPFQSKDAVYWIDGALASLALSLRGKKLQRKPGHVLLRQTIGWLQTSGRINDVLVLGGPPKIPNFEKLAGRSIRHQALPQMNLEEIESFDTGAFASSDIVFLGIASPKQEILAQRIYRNTGAKCFCIGGALNMIEGLETPTPRAINRLGLEWLFRLGHEPKRRIGRFLRTLPGGVRKALLIKIEIMKPPHPDANAKPISSKIDL